MARILMVAPEDALLKALRSSPLLEGHPIDVASGDAAALRRLRGRAFDVLVTSPETSLEEDAAILDDVRRARPGVRVVLLAPRATPEAVILALRRRAFACFSAPFDPAEIGDMLARAAGADSWKDGIEVVFAKPDWISVRVNCALLSAERLLNFLTELRSDVPEAPRDDLMLAFREVLLNAMEYGGGLDWAVNKTVQIRPVEVDYLYTHFGANHVAGYSASQNNFKYAAGVNFTFGNK